jgi:hypothetical protein
MRGFHRTRLAAPTLASGICAVLFPVACSDESATPGSAKTSENAGAGAAATVSAQASTADGPNSGSGPSGTGGAGGMTTTTASSMGGSTGTGEGGTGGSGGAGEGGTGVLTCQWDVAYGGTTQNDSVTVNDVALDKSDNIIAVGSFKGSIDFDGPGGLPPSSSVDTKDDIFIAKYDNKGKLIWRKTFAAAQIQTATAVAIDANNNIGVCGYYFGTLNFGGGSLVNPDNMYPDLYAVVFTAAGAHVASARYGVGLYQTDHCYDIAFAADNDVLITGKFQSKINFGKGDQSATGGPGDHDIFLAKLKPVGPGFTEQFSKIYGSGNALNQEGHALAVAPNGDIGIAGFSDGPIDFGGGALTPPSISPTPTQPVVARLDPSGNQKWAKLLPSGQGGSDNAEGRGIAFHGNDDLVFGGVYRTQIDTGKSILIGSGAANDVFVVRYDLGGNPLWGVRVGDNQSDELTAIAVDQAGFPIFTGKFQGTVFINSKTTLVGKGSFDLSLIRLAGDDGHGYSALGVGDAQYQDATSVAIDSNGNAVLVGNFSGAIDLGGGLKTAPSSSQAFFIASFGL